MSGVSVVSVVSNLKLVKYHFMGYDASVLLVIFVNCDDNKRLWTEIFKKNCLKKTFLGD